MGSMGAGACAVRLRALTGGVGSCTAQLGTPKSVPSCILQAASSCTCRWYFANQAGCRGHGVCMRAGVTCYVQYRVQGIVLPGHLGMHVLRIECTVCSCKNIQHALIWAWFSHGVMRAVHVTLHNPRECDLGQIVTIQVCRACFLYIPQLHTKIQPHLTTLPPEPATPTMQPGAAAGPPVSCWP